MSKWLNEMPYLGKGGLHLRLLDWYRGGGRHGDDQMSEKCRLKEQPAVLLAGE
jgi:hypothetical protein